MTTQAIYVTAAYMKARHKCEALLKDIDRQLSADAARQELWPDDMSFVIGLELVEEHLEQAQKLLAPFEASPRRAKTSRRKNHEVRP